MNCLLSTAFIREILLLFSDKTHEIYFFDKDGWISKTIKQNTNNKVDIGVSARTETHHHTPYRNVTVNPDSSDTSFLIGQADEMIKLKEEHKQAKNKTYDSIRIKPMPVEKERINTVIGQSQPNPTPHEWIVEDLTIRQTTIQSKICQTSYTELYHNSKNMFNDSTSIDEVSNKNSTLSLHQRMVDCKQSETSLISKTLPENPNSTELNGCKTILKPKFDAMSFYTELQMSCGKNSRQRLDLRGFNYTPEDPGIFIFGGINPLKRSDKVNEEQIVWQFKPEKNIWDCVSCMPKKRFNHSAVLYQNRVFIVGGSQFIDHKVGITKIMWSYDPRKQVWFTEKSMPYAIQHFGLVVAHLQIYVIGGEDSNQCPLKTVLRYDPVTAIWTHVCPMHFERIGAAVVTHKSLIWAAGGRLSTNLESFTRSVECYDPIIDQWTINTNLRLPRCFGRMCSIDGYIYIIGGLCKRNNGIVSSMSSIDYYDSKHKTWKLLDELESPRHGHDVLCIGSQMLIIGGVSASNTIKNTLDTVECFCTERLSWINGIQRLPHPITGLVTIAIPREFVQKKIEK